MNMNNSCENKTVSIQSQTSDNPNGDPVDNKITSENAVENSLPDSKTAIYKKYQEQKIEINTLKQSVKKFEKQLNAALHDKERIQLEHSKMVLTKSRLESLCRELHQQNKRVEIRQEEETKKQLSEKFQKTINEISLSLHENNLKNSKLKEENEEMAKKFKLLLEQCEAREQHVDKIIKHKILEAQLAEAQLAKLRVEQVEEQEKFLLEKQELLQELNDSQQKLAKQQALEIQLRSQLNVNMEKYDEFQMALKKSNEIYAEFKKEMDKMTKKIRLLERETHAWRTKFECSNRTLKELCESKKNVDADLSYNLKKVEQLEKLCRALQKERVDLLKSAAQPCKEIPYKSSSCQTENICNLLDSRTNLEMFQNDDDKLQNMMNDSDSLSTIDEECLLNHVNNISLTDFERCQKDDSIDVSYSTTLLENNDFPESSVSLHNDFIDLSKNSSETK